MMVSVSLIQIFSKNAWLPSQILVGELQPVRRISHHRMSRPRLQQRQNRHSITHVDSDAVGADHGLRQDEIGHGVPFSFGGKRHPAAR
jgi:hypothetical protein